MVKSMAGQTLALDIALPGQSVRERERERKKEGERERERGRGKKKKREIYSI
jgi:hypothetical protein